MHVGGRLTWEGLGTEAAAQGEPGAPCRVPQACPSRTEASQARRLEQPGHRDGCRRLGAGRGADSGVHLCVGVESGR